ncbi:MULTISPECIES: hypothetical protein [Kamptonema]|uniref:hypothetical protein n=1 Tax=Kamptonema TaxID=1501433 RepID=UPI0001DAC12C|nr:MULTISPECIES: hypothetical protein [Kamptonema]CBN56610.1 exported hypothetical protein [Kamptonema sp. PCC 6506]
MKLTGATNNTFSSVVNSVKSIATKLPLKVVVASALLIGFTGSMAMDSFVLTAPSYAKTVEPVKAQSAVRFKDANFEARLRQQIGIPNSTPLTLNVLQGVKF